MRLISLVGVVLVLCFVRHSNAVSFIQSVEQFDTSCIDLYRYQRPLSSSTDPFLHDVITRVFQHAKKLTVDIANARVPTHDAVELVFADFGLVMTADVTDGADTDALHAELVRLAAELEAPVAGAFKTTDLASDRFILSSYSATAGFTAINVFNRLADPGSADPIGPVSHTILPRPYLGVRFTFTSEEDGLGLVAEIRSVNPDTKCGDAPDAPTKPRVDVQMWSDSFGGRITLEVPDQACSAILTVDGTDAFPGVVLDMDASSTQASTTFTHGLVPIYHWSPDASNGIPIPHASITLSCGNATFNRVWVGLVTRPAQPDFSMGYNATILICMLVANLVMTVMRSLDRTERRGDDAVQGEGEVEVVAEGDEKEEEKKAQ